ncbi:MAG: phage protease [Kiritimatiellia bacterium]
MTTEIHYGGAVALNWSAEGGGNDAPIAVQLSPFGEFTLRDGGKMDGAVQHCTREAFERLVEAWRAAGSPDILVDVDHASARGGATEAAAWAKRLRVEDDGLYADFELTSRGKELVGDRRYRFVSPGWMIDESATPFELCSVGLTNRPNLPVKPVVNSGDAGGRGPDDPTTENEGTSSMDTKTIAAALGLAETATEEEILAAIAAMNEREQKAAEEKAEAEAEAFAADAVKCGKIAENARAAVKAAYRANKEVAREMLNAIAAPAAQAAPKLPDFSAGKTPTALNAAMPGADADPVAVYNAYVAMAEGREKQAYLAANAAKIEAGYALSRK